jgi:hypothetical protein
MVYEHASPGRGSFAVNRASSRLIAAHRGSDMFNSSPGIPQDPPTPGPGQTALPNHIEQVDNLLCLQGLRNFAGFCRFLHLTTHAKQPSRFSLGVERAATTSSDEVPKGPPHHSALCLTLMLKGFPVISAALSSHSVPKLHSVRVFIAAASPSEMKFAYKVRQ